MLGIYLDTMRPAFAGYISVDITRKETLHDQ
jgi:hypothetical protein